MSQADAEWQQLIEGLRKNDSQIVRQFCGQYYQALQRVAEKHLPAALQRRVGPDDVVQSVCRTFFRRVQAGQFQLNDTSGLWALLCAITLTKIREQARFHFRQKRGLHQEVYLEPDSPDQSRPGLTPVDEGPPPDALAEFADQFQLLVETFDEEERQVLDLRLQEMTQEEIATKLGCSERTVRRLLKRVQARLERVFEAG